MPIWRKLNCDIWSIIHCSNACIVLGRHHILNGGGNVECTYMWHNGASGPLPCTIANSTVEGAQNPCKEWQLVSVGSAGSNTQWPSRLLLHYLIYTDMIFQSYVMGNCASRAITCGFSFRFEFSVKKEPQDKKSDEQKAATGSRKDTKSTPEASEGSSHCTGPDGEWSLIKQANKHPSWVIC